VGGAISRCGAGARRPASYRKKDALAGEELVRLRRENRTLAMEREILRKAAAFFAKESV